MRGYFIISSLMLCFLSFGEISAQSEESKTLSESTIIDALEKGRSLVIADIESFNVPGLGRIVGIKDIQPLILGDLTKEDCEDALDYFKALEDTSSTKLENGKRYALFILKDSPYEYLWVNRTDYQLINDNTDIDKLKRIAENAYAETSISSFRKDSSIKDKIDLDEVPEEIISICKQFRDDPENRSLTAEKICSSDICTRLDMLSKSSNREYFPPEIQLSRDQIVSLLGQPTIKSGRTYSWLCGQSLERGWVGRDVFVLFITFNTESKVQKMIYEQKEKSKWTKISRPVNILYSLQGQPENILLQFQREVRKQNWDKVLSMCSENIREKAQEYTSLKDFFKDYLPIEEINNMREFPTNGYSGSSDKIYKINLDFDLMSDDPENDYSVRWEWSLVKNKNTWLIDFKALPVDILIQKGTFLRKLRDEDYETRKAKFEKGIRYNLIPIAEKFHIGNSIPFRIEVNNIGDEPVVYMMMYPLMINDPMNITGPNGEKIEYVDFTSQTSVWHEVVLPGETIVLEKNYDVCSQYYIAKPGRYTFQYETSNKVELEIKPGELSAMDEVYSKLKEILSPDWNIIRRMAFSQDAYNLEKLENKYLFLHMVGKRRGLQIDNDIRLAIVENISMFDKSVLSEFQIFGSSKYGDVFCMDKDAESLWLDYREQIIKTLGIKEIKP